MQKVGTKMLQSSDSINTVFSARGAAVRARRPRTLGGLLLALTLATSAVAGCAADEEAFSVESASAESAADETVDEGNLVLPQRATVGASVTLDPVEIVRAIDNALSTSADRGAFVKSASTAAFYAAKGDANVIVFNMRQEYSFSPDPKTTLFYTKNYAGITYGVWVFQKAATFTNKGDGGYDNWAFTGYWSRNGAVVNFRNPPTTASTTPANTSTVSPSASDCKTIGARSDCAYRMRVRGDNRYLHEDGSRDKLVSTRYQPNDNFTRFNFLRQSDGSYQIRVKANGRLLHEDGTGDKLVSTRYQPNDNYTRFLLEVQANGTYRIRVKADNRYLHEDGGGDKLVSTRYQTTDAFSEFYIENAQ